MPEPDDTPDAVEEITIDYRKTDQYRTFRLDGVHGGITPQGDVGMYIYTENVHLPDKTTRTVSPEGEMGEPTHHRSENGHTVREVEGGITMDPATALSLIEWLVEQVVKAAHYGIIDEQRLEEVGINVEDIEVEQVNGE